MAYFEDSTDSILTDESASRSSLDIVYAQPSLIFF